MSKTTKKKKLYDVISVDSKKALEYAESMTKGIMDGLCMRPDLQLQDIIIEVWNTKTKKLQKISVAKSVEEQLKAASNFIKFKGGK